MSAGDRDRVRQGRADEERQERERRVQEPATDGGEAGIDPRALPAALRGARSPAGGRVPTLVARSLARLGASGNAALGRVLVARAATTAEAAADRSASSDEQDELDPSATDEQDELDPSAVAPVLAAEAGDRLAERIAAGATPSTAIAVADLETEYLVLEVAAAPGTTEPRVTSSRRAARVSLCDETLDGYARGSDAAPGGGQITTAAADLLAHPHATATIEGFTDEVGEPAANDSLSLRRAERARAAIIAAVPGLAEASVHVAGRGASGFVRPNLLEADRRSNRRVRIRVDEPAP